MPSDYTSAQQLLIKALNLTGGDVSGLNAW